MLLRRDFEPTRLFELQAEYAVFVHPSQTAVIRKCRRYEITAYTAVEGEIKRMTDIITHCDFLVFKSIYIIKHPALVIPPILGKLDHKVVTDDEFLGVLASIIPQSQSAARKEADIQELPHHYATRWENDPDIPRHFVTSMYMATQDSAHTRCPRYSAVQEVQPNLPVYMAVPMVLHPRIKDVYHPIQPLPPLCDDPTNPWFYINDCRRYYNDPPTQLPVPRCIIRGDSTTYSQCPIMKDEALVNSATQLAANYVRKENLIGLSCHALIQLLAGSIKHSAQIRDYIRSLVNKIRKGHKPRVLPTDMSVHSSYVKTSIQERLEANDAQINIPTASDISRPIDPNWLLDFDEMSHLTVDQNACIQEPLLMFTESAEHVRPCDDMIIVRTTGRTSLPISLYIRNPGRFRTTHDFLMLVAEYLALCRKIRSEKDAFRKDPRTWETKMQNEINRKKKNDDLGISNRSRFARIRLREDRAPGNCGVCNIDYKSYFEHIRSTAHLRRYDRLLEQYGLKAPLLETHAFFNKRQAVMSQLSHIATGVALRCADCVKMNANGVCSNDTTGVAAYKDSAACLSEVLRSNVFRCDFRVDQYDIPHASSPTCRNEDFQRWRETVFSSRQKAADSVLESIISNAKPNEENPILRAVKQIAPSVALASLLITREREISMAISSGKAISTMFGFNASDMNGSKELNYDEINKDINEGKSNDIIPNTTLYRANTFTKFVSLANAIVVSMDKKLGNTAQSKGEECIIWPEYLHYIPTMSRKMRDMNTPPQPVLNISTQSEWYSTNKANNGEQNMNSMTNMQTSLPTTGADAHIGFVSISNSTGVNKEEAIPGTLGAVLGRAEVGLPIRLPGSAEVDISNVPQGQTYVIYDGSADVGQNQTAGAYPLITKDGCDFFRKTRDGILKNGAFITTEKGDDDNVSSLTNVNLKDEPKAIDGEDRLVIPRLFSKTHSVFTPICTYAFGDVSNIDNESITGTVVSEGSSIKGVILNTEGGEPEINSEEKNLINVCGDKIHVLADEIRDVSEDTGSSSSSTYNKQQRQGKKQGRTGNYKNGEYMDEIPQSTTITMKNLKDGAPDSQTNDLAILKALLQVPAEFAAELTDSAIHPAQTSKDKEAKKSTKNTVSRSITRSASAAIIRPATIYTHTNVVIDNEGNTARSNSVSMLHRAGASGYYDFIPLSQDQITMRLAEAEGENVGEADKVILPTLGTIYEEDYTDKYNESLEIKLANAVGADTNGLVSPCPNLDLSTAVDAVGSSLWLRYLGGTDAGALACHIRNAAADSINGTAVALPSGKGTHVSVDIWSGILASLLTERAVLRNSRVAATPMYIESRTVRRSMARGGIPQFKE